jgi:uncharacterized protein GlcG (DUF336 family)
VAGLSAKTPASVPCPAGRHWRTTAAWPRRCRRICRGRSGQVQEATALVQHLSVSLAQAKRIVAAAVRRARQIGVSMFIVVVDDCGVIKMSSRMDGNSQASVTVVPPEAVTAQRVPDPPPPCLAQGVAGDPMRLASIVGAGSRLAESSGDASKQLSQPSGGKQ